MEKRRRGIGILRGSHLFRHSLATQMLQHGASLLEIGDLLRHRNPYTTRIYAKVDSGVTSFHCASFAGRQPMKPLREAIEEYINLRRSLGFKLRDMADDLREFAGFLEEKAAPYITTELALEWAMQPKDYQPSTWAQRLGFVRVFARHWHATDPRTEIPADGLLPFRPQPARPYLYSEQEILKLLAPVLQLSSSQGLRPWTYHCLFGLLAVGGLRISEAVKLERTDVDLGEGILTIRQTKFGKTRLVPLHATTQEVMADYAQHRDRLVRHASSPCFLLNDHAGLTPGKYPPSIERSTICRGKSVYAARRTTRARGCTISGIDSPSERWSSGTAPMRISSGDYPFYPPFWGTAMSQTPIGISPWNRN